MNTNGNTYTVIYSTVLVVLVAAILAFVALSLQDKQNENVKLETITKLLSAASQSDGSFVIGEDTDVLGLYAGKIKDAFYVDGNGKKVSEMNTGKENVKEIEVTTTSNLKAENDKMKKIEDGDASLLGELRLPVYVFDINGKDVTVIPCYGAGLWGPVWGYLAIASDGKTVTGAVFDHKGETPGLGAKIVDKSFCDEFIGKTLNMTGETVFAVVKATAVTEPEHSVDAISGATITSQALGKSINLWARYYMPYLSGVAASAQEAPAAEPAAVADEAAAGTSGTNINEEE